LIIICYMNEKENSHMHFTPPRSFQLRSYVRWLSSAFSHSEIVYMGLPLGCAEKKSSEV
jgi:hypothetical protein